MQWLANTRRMLTLLVVAVLSVLMAVPALAADKLHLKDGRVLEGKIQKEGDGYVYFIVKIGSIEHVQFFAIDDIKQIEREEKASAAEAPRSRSGASARSNNTATGSATRVAVLNFGFPAVDRTGARSGIGDTVGIQVAAKAFKDAIPLLEKDNVEVVVVRINSGGGLLLELERFLDLFENQYKKKFRTVGWVESAISAAAMSPYVLEEFYFMPEGNMGACTGWFGALQAIDGIELEEVLYKMEKASEKGGRNPRIMRAMQILETPLSADIDPNTGEVIWRDDFNGQIKVNPANQILTLNAHVAEQTKFSRGTAATVDELMRVMGIAEYVIAGKEATDYINKFMMDADRTERRFNDVANSYILAVNAANALQGEANRVQRGAEISRARRFLNEMRSMVTQNPNFALLRGMDREWFQQQEEMLRRLAR